MTFVISQLNHIVVIVCACVSLCLFEFFVSFFTELTLMLLLLLLLLPPKMSTIKSFEHCILCDPHDGILFFDGSSYFSDGMCVFVCNLYIFSPIFLHHFSFSTVQYTWEPTDSSSASPYLSHTLTQSISISLLKSSQITITFNIYIFKSYHLVQMLRNYLFSQSYASVQNKDRYFIKRKWMSKRRHDA